MSNATNKDGTKIIKPITTGNIPVQQNVIN